MSRWVGSIEPRGQHHHRSPSTVERSFVRGPVDPHRSSGNHDDPLQRRVPCEVVRELERLVVRPPSPYDGERTLEDWERPEDTEHPRLIAEVAEPTWVVTTVCANAPWSC